MSFFNRFLVILRQNGRIAIREIQGMLGLQIWISTVVRVARQFLTSICDILRISGNKKFFYPRKQERLARRLVFDLKFWRRFVKAAPKMAFKYILGQLPNNSCMLASDASTSWGMAGVLTFCQKDRNKRDVDGLFWQFS